MNILINLFLPHSYKQAGGRGHSPNELRVVDEHGGVHLGKQALKVAHKTLHLEVGVVVQRQEEKAPKHVHDVTVVKVDGW